jgi:fusaric acid resistance family protein
MVAVLGAFLTALAIKRTEHLSTSVEVLAVALSLSLGRISQRSENRGLRGRLLALVMLPIVALASTEIGTTIFHHPDLGDTLFVLGMSGSIWVRRVGDFGRRIGTLAMLPLVALLIVPAPVVALHGGGDTRLWSAVISVVALAWVALVSAVAERIGWITAAEEAPRLLRARASARPPEGRRRITPSTKMALQMGVSLGAAFAIGRAAFGMHWTWVVLTAFIVNSGNRGREDVAHKAVMRLIGAGGGTLAASLVANTFAAGDSWSIVCLFAVLSVAVWLRPLNYAFWAAGMTAALALLYGYYGEHGVGLLATRIEGIAIGAAIGVTVSWFLLPIRSTDIIRRDVAVALATLDRYLTALSQEPGVVRPLADRFRAAVKAFEHHATLLRSIPRPLRARIDHLPAIDALALCTDRLPSEPGAEIEALQARIGELRAANARRELPDPVAWKQLVSGLEALGTGPAPSIERQAATPTRAVRSGVAPG